jgi:hypothetical protein
MGNQEFNNKSNMNFEDIFLINKWIKQYILELKNIENELCPCKIKIIYEKWHKIIYWFQDFAIRIIKDDSISLEAIPQSVNKVVVSYENIIYKDETISKRIYSIFKELHTVTTMEFIDIMNNNIGQYNEKNISKLQLIDSLGSHLYDVLINSIFEIHEIYIKCENKNCIHNNLDQELEYVKFLINDMYNINNFPGYKFKKFIEVLGEDISTIDFIADFKYFDDTILSANLLNMLLLAKQKFKSLKIINISLPLLKILKQDFRDCILITK